MQACEPQAGLRWVLVFHIQVNPKPWIPDALFQSLFRSKLSTIEVKSKSFQEKFVSGQKTINALKAGITSIFSKLGCDNAGNRAVLDMGEGVTETNMVQVLGIIEARGNEIMQLYAKASGHAPPVESEEEPPTETPSFLSGKILGPGPQVREAAARSIVFSFLCLFLYRPFLHVS